MMRHGWMKRIVTLGSLTIVLAMLWPGTLALGGPPRQGDTSQALQFSALGAVFPLTLGYAIPTMAFSPAGDRIAGSVVPSPSDPRTPAQVFWWDVSQSGPEVAQSHGLGATYATLAFNSDGTRLAAANIDNVFLLDAVTGRITATFENRVGEGVFDMAFTPDGAYLIVATWHQLMVFDTASGQASQVSLRGDIAGTGAMSEDGRWLATYLAGGITVWNITIDEGAPTLDERISVECDACGNYPTAALSPDGNRLAVTGSQGYAALFDLESGAAQELSPAQNDNTFAGSPSFSADGTLLAYAMSRNRASGFTSEAWVFDVTSGRMVGTLAMQGDGLFKGLMFSPSQPLLAALFDFEIQLWSYSLPAGSVVAAGEGAETGAPAEVIAYTATTPLTAKYHPNGRLTCTIEAGEAVLPAGQMAGGSIQVYAGGAGCEGPVWLTRQDAAGLVGISDAILNGLAIVTTPAQFTVFDTESAIPDYAEVCAGATEWGTPPAGGPPYRASFPASLLPDELQATSDTGLDIIVCVEDVYVPVETCYYTSASGYSATYERRRSDKRITLVDYARRTIVARQTFYGGTPELCPNQISGNGFNQGPMPDYETWSAWAIANLTGSGAPVERTTVATGTINARSEPSTSSEVLTQLTGGTPVNLIGRNEAGDWALALTPDMNRVWLYAGLLQVARRTKVSLLPVVDGPAAAVSLP